MGLRQRLPEPAKSVLRQIKQAVRKPCERAADLADGFLRHMGLVVYRYRPDYHYCPRLYGANQHKLLDIRDVEIFGELAKEVLSHGKTTLYYDRLYFLYQSISRVSQLPGNGANLAEIGVYKGGGTYFIASVVDKLFQEKPLIHSFDTFEGHPEEIHPELDGGHYPGAFRDTSFAEVKNYLAVFDNVVLHKGRFQENCSSVSGQKFSFVHIDVDIYSATRDCLEFFADLLIPAGIILVDDYGFTTCKGSKEAVDSFVNRKSNFMKIHLLTGQCMLIRIS
jgi:O-methyltransferase